jgi:hypothetical protein
MSTRPSPFDTPSDLFGYFEGGFKDFANQNPFRTYDPNDPTGTNPREHGEWPAATLLPNERIVVVWEWHPAHYTPPDPAHPLAYSSLNIRGRVFNKQTSGYISNHPETDEFTIQPAGKGARPSLASTPTGFYVAWMEQDPSDQTTWVINGQRYQVTST